MSSTHAKLVAEKKATEAAAQQEQASKEAA
jgi:hypothetical protein